MPRHNTTTVVVQDFKMFKMTEGSYGCSDEIIGSLYKEEEAAEKDD